MPAVPVGSNYILDRPDFPEFLGALRSAGYQVVGPTVRDGAIVYGEIRTEKDLPIGWTDQQEPGKYRLERRADEALFGYNVGPHSWKKYLFPPRERLWTATRTEAGFEVQPESVDGPAFAFLGVRACELAGLDVTDRVFDGRVRDPGYHARRSRILRIAVQCGQAGGTCFCLSMGTGPAIRGGCDLTLTEILEPGPHRFLVAVGSEEGARVLEPVKLRPAEPDEGEIADRIVDRTAATMGRSLDTTGVHDLLLGNPEHPRWEIVAKRCLSCTNCTMVCPTCFCNNTEEVPDLEGTTVEKWRHWDSCFNLEFTQLHGNSVRKTTLSRYRQWLTHKLAGWQDQFGTSGCIGCGRCVTWCPVGIDLTEEVAALRVPPAKPPAAGGAA